MKVLIIYVNKNHLINLKKSFHSSVKYLYSQTFLEAFLTLTSVNGLIKFPVNSSYCRQFEYLSNSSSVRVLLKCNCCYLIREGFKKKSIMENSILGGQVGGHQSGTVKFFSAKHQNISLKWLKTWNRIFEYLVKFALYSWKCRSFFTIYQ